MKRSYRNILMMAVLLMMIGLGGGIKAQGPDPGWVQHGKGDIRDFHAKNLENLRLLKLIEVLDLDDQESPKFIAAFTSFRKQARAINDSIQSEVDNLATAVESDSSNTNAIRAGMTRINDLKGRREEALRHFHNEIGQFLTTVQMGKVVVFEERFDRELIENLGRFRRQHMDQGNP